MRWNGMQSQKKLLFSASVAFLVVLSALVVPLGAASAHATANTAPPAISSPITLTPNEYLAAGTTQLTVTSSSASFNSGSTVYYEFETSPVWVPAAAALWMTLSAQQTTLPSNVLTPSPTGRSAGTYYFLISATTSGTLGVFSSEALTASATAPSAAVVPSSGNVGSMANVTGSGYDAGATIAVYWFTPGPTTLGASEIIATGTASATGTIHIPITIPNTVYGSYDIAALATNTTSGNSIYGYDAGVWFAAFSVTASITVAPASIDAEGSFTLSGTGFIAATAVTITDNNVVFASPVTFTPDANGAFSGTVSTAGGTFTPPGYGGTIVTATQTGLLRPMPTVALTLIQPTITVNPTAIVTGQGFTVSGAHFGVGSVIAANSITINGVTARNSAITVGATGAFSVAVATASMTTFTTGANPVSLTASQTGLSQAATATLTFNTYSITVTPSTISPGQSVTITGSNFFPSATIGANSIVIGGATVTNAVTTVASDGSFSVVASTLSFTGTLTSGSPVGVSVPVALPAGVTVNTHTTETGVGSVDLSSPTISIALPAGVYSLSPGQTVTVSGSNFFPGATIAANSITLGRVAGTNSAVTVLADGTFSVAFTLPASVTASGVYALNVPEVPPNGLTVSPSAASLNVILSSPTLDRLTIALSATASSVPVTSLNLQSVGNTVYVYLLGYPSSASGISLMVGGTVVLTGISVDANGAFLGTFTIPPLAGADGGVDYTVQTQSILGLQAQNPADLLVYPTVNVLTGTEPYFTDPALSIGYLAAGDTATIKGTGYDALSLVIFFGSATGGGAVISSTTTNQYGSFSATLTVGSVTTNTVYTLGASTTHAHPGSHSAFAGYAAPVVLVLLPGTTPIGATGSAPTATGTSLVSAAESGITVNYTVSGPIGASTVVTHAAATSPITVTAANGVYTETISGSAPFNTLTGTAVFEVTNAGSAGFLKVLNAAGQESNTQSVTPGGSFYVFAIGFATEASSSIALGATGPAASFSGLATVDQAYKDATDGGAIFFVTASAVLTAGTYLIFGTQSPSYTTSLPGSVVVNVGPVITVSGGTSGGTFVLSGDGFTPDTTFSVYFGHGVSAGMNLGAVMSDGVGDIFNFLGVPIIDGGVYMVGLAPYTAASSIPASAVMPSTLTAMTVNNNVLWAPDPAAFPGQLVSFAYTTVLSSTPIPGTVTAAVLLNGVPYATVPASYSAGVLSGSFTMFNGMPGATYTLSLQPIYQAITPVYSNDTQTAQFTTGAAQTTQTLKWSIPAGTGTVVSAAGFYGAVGAAPVATPAAVIVQPTALLAGSVTVALTGLSISTSYIVTETIEIQGWTSIGHTLVGAASNAATLTLVNGSGALVLSISHSDIVEIATLSGAYVNVTLAQLNATINKIYSVQGHMYASLTSGFGNMTVSLAAIKASVASVSSGVATIQTSLGTVTAVLGAIGATLVSVQSTVLDVNTTLGEVKLSLAQVNANVTSVHSGIMTLTTDVGTLQLSVTQLGVTLSTVNGNVMTILTDMGTVQASLASLSTSVTALGVSITSIQSNVNTLLGASVRIETSLGNLTGTVAVISGNVATIVTAIGSLQTAVSQIQGSATSIQSNTNQITTYFIIVIVLVLIAIVLALLAVMRVNAIARHQQGAPKAWQKGPEGGAQEPPK